MTVNIDELGPVDWIVVEFPGTKLTGEIAPIVKDYVDRGLIKVLDLVFLTKDQDGGLEAFEASDLGDSEIGELRGYERDLAMVLSEQDVADLAETIEPGSSAAVLVWENLWAAPFGAAVRHAGGQLAASGRIPIQAVLAAIEADAGEADAGKEPDMPLAARRRRRTVAAVGGAVVVAHGVHRRGDRRDDRRDDRDDRRDDRGDRREDRRDR